MILLRIDNTSVPQTCPNNYHRTTSTRMTLLRATQAALLCSSSFLFLSCSEKERVEVTSQPASSPWLISKSLEVTQSTETPLFSLLAPINTGVTHTNNIDTTHPLKRLYVSGWVCGGVMVADFNTDGKPDLFFPSNTEDNRLYLQTSPLVFKEVASTAGVDQGGFSVGASVGDIDGDGDIDIHVCNYESPNQLFLNQGNDENGTPIFKEVASLAGLATQDTSLTSTLCDFDQDGDLDLFILTNRNYRDGEFPEGKKWDFIDGKPTLKAELRDHYRLLVLGKNVIVSPKGRRDYLFRNDGAGEDNIPQFTDISQQAGIDDTGYGLSATWWDYNDDGFPDLYIANDFEYPDRLYQNRGDGTFALATPEVISHTSYYSMGSAAGDFNNDGREDFFSVDMAATSHYKAKISMGTLDWKEKWTLDFSEPRQIMRNSLQINTGKGRMMETAYLSGIAQSDWSWTPLLADYDNDGKLDVIITNGMARDFANADIGSGSASLINTNEWDRFEKTATRPEQNLAYQNQGALKFKNVSKSWGLDHTGMSYGASWADLDGDGNLDVIVSNLNEPPSIYRNNGGKNNKVTIALKDTSKANPQGIGSKVTAYTRDGKQVRSLHPANGFLNSNQSILHFGLGDNQQISHLTVRWPDGAEQTLANLPANSHHTITRDPSAISIKKAQSPTLFVKTKLLASTPHTDSTHDDFSQQPLLPNKLSHQGPGHAWGDVNGDGKDDLYLAMGAGTADRLLIRSADRFVTDSFAPFDADESGESIAPLIFDADSDCDNDIYVSRGSYEFPADDSRQQDILYLNDGKGNFTKAPTNSLPNSSIVSGHVSAADFDRDGDLDLFVACRVTPGKYPTATASRLLRNDSTNGIARFTNVTDTLAPALQTAGMVTAATWSDANADGWIDLLIATEWGPIKMLRNQNGKLTDNTDAAGLSGLTGWWNSITGADIDHDGDIDYICGNLGLNTKYHPNKKKPALIYYGDMDGSGIPRIVEAKSSKDKDRPLPVRGRS